MQQYLDLAREAIAEGTYKPNRTGVDTLATFGAHYEVDLSAMASRTRSRYCCIIA